MTADSTTRPAATGHLLSLGRIATIASGTVTQLVRMKTFYFLLAFAIVIVALRDLNIPTTAVKELSTIKKVSFGTMDLFAWLFAIVSTAILIPRDLEDRTLYTILAKPVRRIEYLLGKLAGVLVVVGVSLAAMALMCGLMLKSREVTLVGEEVAAMQSSGEYSQAEIAQQVGLIQAQGLRPGLGVALLASFLKASVVAAVTLFLSTFASSTLFTILVSFFTFLIGHAHSMASDFWLNETNQSLVVRMLVKVIKILIPDYQLFSFAEGIVAGEAVVPVLVWQMAALTAGYLIVFLFLSLLVFIDKEF